MIEPDSFLGRPLAWAGNQSGHVVIGLTIGAVLWPLLGAWAMLAGVVAYWLVIEVGQQDGRRWVLLDSVSDTAFVAGGLWIAAYVPWQFILVLDAALLFGMYRRWV